MLCHETVFLLMESLNVLPFVDVVKTNTAGMLLARSSRDRQQVGFWAELFFGIDRPFFFWGEIDPLFWKFALS